MISLIFSLELTDIAGDESPSQDERQGNDPDKVRIGTLK